MNQTKRAQNGNFLFHLGKEVDCYSFSYRYRSTFVLSFKYRSIFTLYKVQKYLLISFSPQSSTVPALAGCSSTKSIIIYKFHWNLMKNDSFERLLTKFPECVSNSWWEKYLVYQIIMFVYLHSVPALKMLEKSNKHWFLTRLDRFGGNGDK